MGMVVRSNIMALNANRQLGMNNTQVSKSLEKLSSGFKINRAGDDASGLAISEKMKAQIKGLETASANSQDGISLVQTAEGALTEVHSMLNRMVELATKSANGTMQDDVDRDAIQSEVDALTSEIDRIGDSTNFNGINLLNGSLGGYIGGNAAAGGIVLNSIKVSGGSLLDTDAVILTGTATGGVSVKTVGTDTTGSGASDIAGGVTGITFEGLSSSEHGKTYTLKAIVDESTASAADVAKFKGMEITFTMGDTFAAADATFTIAADGNGNIGNGLTLQIGDSSAAFNKMTVSVEDMRSAGLGISGLDVSTADSAASAIQTIKDAINKVSTNRADMGALQNRLEYTINNLDVSAENLTSANSRIRDTDMAKEMMNYTKMNVLTQAAQAMLAQANQQPQSILQLLQ